MSFSFQPPLEVVYHEIGHAMLCYAKGVPITTVSVETLYRFGKVDVGTSTNEETHLLISMAGPIAQQIFQPNSITDHRLQGLLFDASKSTDFKHWLNMEAAVSSSMTGWSNDLRAFYRKISFPLASCAERVAPFATAEQKIRHFFSDPSVTQMAHTLAKKLSSSTQINGTEMEAMLSQYFQNKRPPVT